MITSRFQEQGQGEYDPAKMALAELKKGRTKTRRVGVSARLVKGKKRGIPKAPTAPHGQQNSSMTEPDADDGDMYRGYGGGGSY